MKKMEEKLHGQLRQKCVCISLQTFQLDFETCQVFKTCIEKTSMSTLIRGVPKLELGQKTRNDIGVFWNKTISGVLVPSWNF